MNSNFLIPALVIGIFSVAAALLAWFAIDLGTNTLKRYQATFTEKAQFQAREFFLFIDPQKLFLANLALMGLGGVLVWLVTGSVVIALAVFAVMALMPRVLYRWMRLKRLARYEAQLPDALMALSGSMQAGAGLGTAIGQLVRESPAPLGQEFGLMLREQRMGVPLEQALANLSRRVPTQTNILVVSAMRIALETGGSLAQTLERTAHTIRSRLQMEGKIKALTAQGKLQAWVVGMLPMFLMLVLNHMEPEGMAMLWHTELGWATLVVIAFLEVMGIYVIRKIIAIDV
ncbi:Uncharacterised protein [uncultured Comamonas sp.]|nr:Uncharacterised protein [uncultured Comamonas sp.]